MYALAPSAAKASPRKPRSLSVVVSELMSSTTLPSSVRFTRPARSTMNVSLVLGRTAITIGAWYEPASAKPTFRPSSCGRAGAVEAGAVVDTAALLAVAAEVELTVEPTVVAVEVVVGPGEVVA